MLEIPVLPADLAKPYFAKILKLALLRKTGGVWIDASMLIKGKMQNWLNSAKEGWPTDGGLYAFGSDTSKSTVAVEGVLVATAGSTIIRAWHVEMDSSRYSFHLLCIL
jgi:hypothetical protein